MVDNETSAMNNQNYVQTKWIDGEFNGESIGDKIKMIDNDTAGLNTQNLMQTKWIDGDFKSDEQVGDHIKMKDNEMSYANQDLLQVQHKLPVDDQSEKVQDRWESVMESLGHMNERTDYTPEKGDSEGYYSLKTNNADHINDEPVWKNSIFDRPTAPLEQLDGGDTEKVSELQPLSYQARAIMNYFGYRTTFYGQLAQDINVDEEEVAPHYNKDAGLWMGPSFVQTETSLPVDDAADKVQDSWESTMESLGHMNERTDYDPLRKRGEGYYTLKSNSASEADVEEPVWKETKIPAYKSPAEDEFEKVSVLQPLSY